MSSAKRDMKPLPPRPDEKAPPYYIVQPLGAFSAGELWLGFGPEQWTDQQAVFGKQELELMDTRSRPSTRSWPTTRTSSRPTPTDPGQGILTLASGQQDARRLAADRGRARRGRPTRRPEAQSASSSASGSPEDTDTKEVGSTDREVTRAWDIKADDDPTLVKTIRLIPENYPAALEADELLARASGTPFSCAPCACWGR